MSYKMEKFIFTTTNVSGPIQEPPIKFWSINLICVNTDEQTLGLVAGVDFTKNVGVNAGYDIDLTGKNNNKLNLGFDVKF